MPSKKKKENATVIEGPKLKIQGKEDRFEIVKKVVSHFIDFERSHKGKGVEFRYPVESLPNNKKLYIHRPGIKWNFDFKVEIPEGYGIGEGRHEQIALILRKFKNKNQNEFKRLWNIITKLYKCQENDVSKLLRQANFLDFDINLVGVLLKLIKWLFIMEDIIYWHYEGRAFLYNFLFYVVNENYENRLSETLEGMRNGKVKPERIKELLETLGLNWQLP